MEVASAQTTIPRRLAEVQCSCGRWRPRGSIFLRTGRTQSLGGTHTGVVEIPASALRRKSAFVSEPRPLDAVFVRAGLWLERVREGWWSGDIHCFRSA